MKSQDIRIRDPFFFEENGKYYLLGTTGDDPWEHGTDFTLYETEDLTDFRPVCRMVEDGTLEGKQFWAPELHKYRGKYYLLVSVYDDVRSRGSIFLVSDTLKGPYVPLTGERITPAGWTCLDATLFEWKGKPYLCFSNEWIDAVTRDGDGSLYIAELTEDLKAIVRYKKIVSGKYCGFSEEIETRGIRGYVAEGPFLWEEDGHLVLLWSTYTKNGYSVIESEAKEPFGEYVFRRNLFDDDGGHCMLFTYGGRRKLVLHHPNTAPDERAKVFDLEELRRPRRGGKK